MKKDNYDPFSDPLSPLNPANSMRSLRRKQGDYDTSVDWKEIFILLIILILVIFALPPLLDIIFFLFM